MPSQNKRPSLQDIQNCTDTIVESLEWIKDQTPSVKAKRFAGKALLQIEMVEAYAEKAFDRHEQKQDMVQDQNNESTVSKFRSNRKRRRTSAYSES